MLFIARLGILVIAIIGIAAASTFGFLGGIARHDAMTKLHRIELSLYEFRHYTEGENIVVVIPGGRNVQFPRTMPMSEISKQAQRIYQGRDDYKKKADRIEWQTQEVHKATLIASLSLPILLLAYLLSCVWIWVCLGQFSFSVLRYTKARNASSSPSPLMQANQQDIDPAMG